MKRSKEENPDMIRWRKIGGGAFNMPNRIIKPNQEFSARLEDIPENFRDVVVPLNEKEAAKIRKKEETPSKPAVKLKYFVKARGGGYYNVEDQDGKVQNEKALRKDAADALIANLLG